MIAMRAKFTSVCACGQTLNKGDDIFYFPKEGRPPARVFGADCCKQAAHRYDQHLDSEDILRDERLADERLAGVSDSW